MRSCRRPRFPTRSTVADLADVDRHPATTADALIAVNTLASSPDDRPRTAVLVR